MVRATPARPLLAVVPALLLSLHEPSPGAGRAPGPPPSSSPAPGDEARADPPDIRGWVPGKGWGWIWGPDDEVGSLNGLTDASRRRALALVKRGQVFDLGQTYSRRSYKWSGHNPGEIISFRSPDGLLRMGDPDAPPRESNRDLVLWHSCALFLSDNVGTQIDGLGHITAGPDLHWYNGFREGHWGGDWGIRRADSPTIPPIVARGVLVDVAAHRGVEALPAHEVITRDEIEAVLRREGVGLLPGDVVLFRTGTGRFWKDEGTDHEALARHDSAGPDLEAIRWLVEAKGAVLIGSDTSGLEVNPPRPGSGSSIPVHRYLLVDQGVHLGELHNLEGLSREEVYEFCYLAQTNRVRGAVSGFALRPIALR